MSDINNLNAERQSSKDNNLCIQPGIYRHYKGGEYQVIDTAIHSETEELVVVYRPLYGKRELWVRPLEMFKESIVIDGQEVPRFEFVQQ